MRRAILGIVCLSQTFAVSFVRSEEKFDAARIKTVTVEPESIQLTGPGALRGLLVHGHRGDGRLVDLTHRTKFRSTAPAHFAVSRRGVVSAVTDGRGEVEIQVAGKSLLIPVLVQQTTVPREYHFERDIVPILSKYGCNSSGCHGKAEGKNGFKLTVFGFDPVADFNALTKEARGRRTFTPDADRSLLLTKASGRAPHGGGARIAYASPEYNTLRGWIAAGSPFGDPSAPAVERVEITPSERAVDTNATQQLRVTAFYTDGRQVDVTSIAKYQSNNEGLADVDAAGLVRIGKVPGQVAVMATYRGAVDTFLALIPRSERIENYPALKENNFIDSLVHKKLKTLSIIPSGQADDAEFLRRVYLDIIGTLPTADEARRFLKDKRPDRRSLLVNELLKRPEYADFWALKWADLMRVDRRALGRNNAYAYHGWIRKCFAENKPLDRFVRDILTLRGRTANAPQVNFYRAVGGPNQLANTVSQVFLGVRIECAQCHHHPFDRWSQNDYYGMTAFFQQVSRKGTTRGEIMLAAGDPETKHPRTGARIYAHALGKPMPEKSPQGDRRKVLADWMTAPDNPWFARNAVNRVWAHFLGRGLVEPVDDFRDTNPATNQELMDALAKHFVENGYDLHKLIRTITASQTYQHSSQPNETNEKDEQNYSRALFKRLDAEVLLDAVCQVSGRDEKFRGVPHGYRAVQLWDSMVDHYFLKQFGRPMRKTACTCERNAEPSVSQVLHILNSPDIHAKLSHEAGLVARLVDRIKSDKDLIDELFLTYFGRFPTADEKSTTFDYFQKTKEGRRVAAEDLAWSLMNSLEFLFNH